MPREVITHPKHTVCQGLEKVPTTTRWAGSGLLPTTICTCCFPALISLAKFHCHHINLQMAIV